MITVNSLSGGKTSSYIAVHYPADHDVFSVVCLDDANCTPKDPAVLKYAQEKLSKFNREFGEFIATAEDDKTLLAMMHLEQYIGREITWVRGMSFDNLLRTKTMFGGGEMGPGRLPSWARRYCTSVMKLQAIFEWWFNNVYEKVDMRLGFRFDEFKRMEKFFNNGTPGIFKMPTSCSTQGKRLQKKEDFLWRYCSFPLIQTGVDKSTVNQYWKDNGLIPATLFSTEVKMEFPVISNCVGCFHKKTETLAIMWEMHPEKMQWFADQELIGKGTWLDNNQTYQSIGNNRFEVAKEVMYEFFTLGETCDSGGCTD